MHPRAPVVRLVVVLLLALVSWPSAGVAGPPAASAQTEADAAAEFAYGLSGLERDGNFDQLYNLMHPDAKAIIPRSAVVGWYREEFAPLQPQEISEIVAVRQVSWTWPVSGQTYPTTYEVDYVRPFGVGQNLEHVSDTVRLVPTGNSFGWFFGRSQEFVEEQIARFPGELEPAQSTGSHPSGQPPSSAAQTGPAGCTLVELYPGYPGYRGNVTGVMPHWSGLGDWECLETLEAQDLGFSRSQEDRANRDAADALGINGPMELWTWENWMLIEAERGLPPSCYTCFIVDPSSTPLRTDVDVDPSDPRISTGLAGSTLHIRAILNAVEPSGAYQIRTVEEFFGNDQDRGQAESSQENQERLLPNDTLRTRVHDMPRPDPTNRSAQRFHYR